MRETTGPSGQVDGYEVRRVRAEEWRKIRALRLEALQDPVAHLAFLETYDEGLARPDEEWRQRTADAAAGDAAAQFVAVAGDVLVGNVVVLVNGPGERDYLGEVSDRRRAALVGVFVRAEHRGFGLIEELVDAASAWVVERGIGELALHVHEHNTRAQASYRRCGFVATGRVVELPTGTEVEMVR